MWTASQTALPDGDRRHYAIASGSAPLGFFEAIELWKSSEGFRDYFCELLRAAPYGALRWETPPLTRANARRPFEFVLLDSPWLAGRPDPSDFSGHFDGIEPDGVASFANLGGDAILVAPAVNRPGVDYGHLAAWLRNAPPAQQHALWRAVADAVLARLGDRPLWLSTAGGGVPWLHLRIDDRPKYYGHAPYRDAGHAR